MPLTTDFILISNVTAHLYFIFWFMLSIIVIEIPNLRVFLLITCFENFEVVLHTELERKLPAILLEKVDKNELIEYPNNSHCKLGFLDLILRKWFCNPFTDDGEYVFWNCLHLFQ